MNSEYICAFHNSFLLKQMIGALEFKMNAKLREIQKKLADLQKEAKDIKTLRSDVQYVKQFNKMIVKHQVD